MGPAARRGSNVVSLRLAGGARPSRVEPQDQLPGKVHHFDANDPQQWRRDIPTFRRVAYRDVYPATDLVFHGSQGAVEFDFVLRPGADTIPAPSGSMSAAPMRSRSTARTW